jgi:tetratricopeptide (TPR) repeat protein
MWNLDDYFLKERYAQQNIRMLCYSLSVAPLAGENASPVPMIPLRKAGRAAEAIEAFQQALQINPDYVKAWVGLGLAYRDAGQQEQAREAFKRLKALDPAAADAFSDKK